MKLVYITEVHKNSGVILVKNNNTNEIICRVFLHDHDTDERALHFANLIAINLTNHFKEL